MAVEFWIGCLSGITVAAIAWLITLLVPRRVQRVQTRAGMRELTPDGDYSRRMMTKLIVAAIREGQPKPRRSRKKNEGPNP